MKVVIAAAGTGGHINPGIAIANKIKKESSSSEIIFIGTNRGLETDLVPRSGYELKTIEAYGIERKISIENIKNIFKTLKSKKEVEKILLKFKPDIVVGTGGYICIPTILAAKKLNIPTILHESNAYPGVSVKLLSKKVNTVLVAFEDAKERLPKAKRIVITGTPTKIKKVNLTDEQKLEMKKQLGIKNDIPIILIFGGSQGAKSINTSIMDILKNKMNTDYQIIWAVGPKQFDIIKDSLKQDNTDINNVQNAKIVPYIYNMEEIMNLSDVIISRSGAMTITEIAITGKPAIFIPFPFATENHQEYNAKVLENAEAAKIILDKDLNSKILNDEIHNLLKDKVVLKKMGNNAEKVATKNVEDKIYEEIIKLVK